MKWFDADRQPIRGFSKPRTETFRIGCRVVDASTPERTSATRIFICNVMKKDLHPEYKQITITLADGSTFETRSTLDRDDYESDVDSTNHPFYTGRRQFVDTAGRVEKFNRRYGLNNDDEENGESEEETEE